jgi:hypothetical protein
MITGGWRSMCVAMMAGIWMYVYIAIKTLSCKCFGFLAEWNSYCMLHLHLKFCTAQFFMLFLNNQ